MNQFIIRLVNHFVNEVLVEGLAKSRTFQRFAVVTDATIKDIQKASADKLKTAFEEFSGQQQVYGMKSNGPLPSPPPKPLTGFPGFVSAFIKEVRKDMGIGR
jgi:hypothetical protein